MRGLMVCGVACLALAACTPESTEPAAEDTANATPLDAGTDADLPPPPVNCAQINTVLAAFGEPTPFASLRSSEATAGNQVASNASPANARCTIGDRKGDGPAAPTIHVMNCTLYTSGASDRARDAVPAKQAFLEARRQLDACIPADWTMRDGAVAETDANEAMIYESNADAQRAMTESFYTYPVQLKKAWVDGEGWRVTLDFQKEAVR